MKRKYFISALAPKIKAFLEFKESLGIDYKSSRCFLRQLDEYNYNNGNSEFLLKEIVESWAIKYDSKSLSQDRSWVPPVREFGRYLQRTGEKNAYILDNRFKMQRYHAVTYLMSDSEIQKFFSTCDIFSDNSRNPAYKFVLPAIYRFMYCCGVRTGETRKLKCSDVNLKERYIDIILSKKHKDRRLFLSEELNRYLENYNRNISEIFPEREYFFPNTEGNMCSGSTITLNFKKIWIDAGLKFDGEVKPRVYDFRHHFACANLIRWSRDGKDINAMLPYLMRYMGHSSIESTYYYIHLLPDFFPQYNLLSSSTENLIPEVGNEI